MGFLSPKPGYTDAYHVDSSMNEYNGRALRGSLTSDPRWQIMKVVYTGRNWIVMWPNGSDEPKFIWNNCESYTYELLK